MLCLRKDTAERVVEVRAGEVLNIHERVDAGPSGVLRLPVCQTEVDRDARRRRDVGGGVDPGPPVQQVIAAPAVEHVIAGAPVQHVVAAPAHENVIAAAAGEDVVAIQAREPIIGAIAGEGVVEVGADEVLNTHERVEPGSPRILRARQIEVDRDPRRGPDIGRRSDAMLL